LGVCDHSILRCNQSVPYELQRAKITQRVGRIVPSLVRPTYCGNDFEKAFRDTKILNLGSSVNGDRFTSGGTCALDCLRFGIWSRRWLKKKPRHLFPKGGVIALATSYFRTTYRCTIIGAAAFHFRVRNGNGWVHCAGITRSLTNLKLRALWEVAHRGVEPSLKFARLLATG
jgi:hypothetical protein